MATSSQRSAPACVAQTVAEDLVPERKPGDPSAPVTRAGSCSAPSAAEPGDEAQDGDQAEDPGACSSDEPVLPPTQSRNANSASGTSNSPKTVNAACQPARPPATTRAEQPAPKEHERRHREAKKTAPCPTDRRRRAPDHQHQRTDAEQNAPEQPQRPVIVVASARLRFPMVHSVCDSSREGV